MRKIARPIYIAIIVLIIAVFFTCEGLTGKNLTYNYSFVTYGGTFKYNDLKILGIPIYWFMLILGFSTTILVSIYKRSYYEISKIKAIIFPCIILILGIIGGKIMYILENYSYTKINGIGLGGMSLYGAIYLIFLTTPIIAKCGKISIKKLYDLNAFSVLILLSGVRMGCFFNGCCGANIIWKGNVPIILPVQLFEVICDLLILEFCFRVEKKYPFKGFMYPIFMFTYGICRFFLEFLRNTPKNTLHLSHGQIFSLIAIVVSITLFMIIKKIDEKQKKST